MNAQKDVAEKVVIIGDAETGKTTLLSRFTENKFSNTYEPTRGADFRYRIIVDPSDNRIGLQIWDCSGDEKYKSITPIYYKDAKFVIVCVDLKKPITFDDIKDRVNEVRNKAKQTKIMLVGTKADLIAPEEIETHKETLERIKQDLNSKDSPPFIMNVFITSAKTGKGISEVFQGIGEAVVEDNNNRPKAGSVIIKSATKKDTDDEPDFAINKLNFWQRHKRKIITGIIIGAFVVAAVTLIFSMPYVVPFLASIGLAISFTGYTGMTALAGIGAAIGLVTGSIVAGITFGLEAMVRKLSRIGKVDINSSYDGDKSQIYSKSTSLKGGSSNAKDSEKTPLLEDVHPPVLKPVTSKEGNRELSTNGITTTYITSNNITPEENAYKN